MSKHSSGGEKRFAVAAPKDNIFSNPDNIRQIKDEFDAFQLKAKFVTLGGIALKDTRGMYTLVTRDERAGKVAPQILAGHGLKFMELKNP